MEDTSVSSKDLLKEDEIFAEIAIMKQTKPITVGELTDLLAQMAYEKLMKKLEVGSPIKDPKLRALAMIYEIEDLRKRLDKIYDVLDHAKYYTCDTESENSFHALVQKASFLTEYEEED